MAKTVPLVDTSIIIEVLKGSKKLRSFLREEAFFYSVITRKELFQKRGLSQREIFEIERYLGYGRMIFIDTSILEGVRLLSPLYKKMHIRDANDIIIAATCLVKCLPLATLNKKHFSFIKGIRLLNIKTL